ncbi:unnamed protein product [Rotaria magnacalcarata]
MRVTPSPNSVVHEKSYTPDSSRLFDVNMDRPLSMSPFNETSTFNNSLQRSTWWLAIGKINFSSCFQNCKPFLIGLTIGLLLAGVVLATVTKRQEQSPIQLPQQQLPLQQQLPQQQLPLQRQLPQQLPLQRQLPQQLPLQRQLPQQQQQQRQRQQVCTTYMPQCTATATTIAGISGISGAASNQLSYPYDITLDSSNTLYIADRGNNRVQQWVTNASSGSTVAGQASGAVGSALNYFNRAGGVVIDSAGNLYVTDPFNDRVQYWANGSMSGSIIIGTGACSSALNELCDPYGIARDTTTGTLYIGDYSNDRVMMFLSGASSGTVVAGGTGSGTGSTQLFMPFGIYLDSATNSLLIANSGANNIVRWVIGASTWTLVAGSSTGQAGSTATLLNAARSLTLDVYGNLYVADTWNHRIQFFPVGQMSGITIAGVNSVFGSSSSLLYAPYAMKLDIQGNLYVADTYNHRVQKYTCL